MISKRALEILEKEVMKLPNVVGFSKTLHKRVKNGKEVNELCIRVYVSKKVSEKELKPEDVIPKKIDGIPTDVYVIGEIKKLNFHVLEAVNKRKTEKIRPLNAGVSIGHYNITAGTLGFYVKFNGDVYLLSNNHVFADENKAKIGDPILQQGMYDIPDKDRWREYICGELFNYIPLEFEDYTCPYRRMLVKIGRRLRLIKKAKPNLVDVAIASPKVDWEAKFIDIVETVRGVNYEPTLDMKVQKTGRTTCHTTNGKIVDLNWYGKVQYSRGIAVFDDQILVYGEGFSAGGDSGSLIMDENYNAVGLLFAGSESYTVANKIKHVENMLGVKVLIV